MDHAWIAIVLAAAALQTARNAGQKHLSGRMSAVSASWVRFGFGLPFGYAWLCGILFWFDLPLPEPGPDFLMPAVLAAVSQIAATLLLILLFRMRNFAVGSTYVRSETVFAAVLGTVLFDETLSLAGWTAILISASGVVILSLTRSNFGPRPSLASFLTLAAGIGVMTGGGFAAASFFVRQASLSFGHPNFGYTAAVTLAAVLTMQACVLGLLILATRPGDFRVMRRLWKPSLLVGVASAFGSVGWFTAMTIKEVAYVKALAQIEALFALAASMVFFGERPERHEYAGMALIATGTIVLVLFAR